MFFALLAAMDSPPAVLGTPPSTTAPTVATLNAGACSGTSVGTPASLRVSWTVSLPDDTHYTTKVYENGIAKASVATSTTHWDKTVSGSVEGGAHATSSNWTYRIDVVRNSDSAVVSSQTAAAAWIKFYGDCTGGV